LLQLAGIVLALWFIAGAGIGGAILAGPSQIFENQLKNFLEALNLVLDEIKTYLMESEAQAKVSNRWILGHWTFDDLRRRTDLMLVGLASKIIALENLLTSQTFGFDKPDVRHQNITDELTELRDRREKVHNQAVKLGLAEKNPQIYFNRAVLAQKANEIKPAH
jgi:hypothetical protein